mmetsp:Transcript_9289/g.18944  ORF Transcript_9289/g.18944 Transcript_9289/m.18944 type:complete len:83 (+) Transcript_9289:745-993(+)
MSRHFQTSNESSPWGVGGSVMIVRNQSLPEQVIVEPVKGVSCVWISKPSYHRIEQLPFTEKKYKNQKLYSSFSVTVSGQSIA